MKSKLAWWVSWQHASLACTRTPVQIPGGEVLLQKVKIRKKWYFLCTLPLFRKQSYPYIQRAQFSHSFHSRKFRGENYRSLQIYNLDQTGEDLRKCSRTSKVQYKMVEQLTSWLKCSIFEIRHNHRIIIDFIAFSTLDVLCVQ